MSDDQFILHVQWDKPGLPSLLGPFETRREAHKWVELNVSPADLWEVRPLAYPHYRRPVPKAAPR